MDLGGCDGCFGQVVARASRPCGRRSKIESRSHGRDGRDRGRTKTRATPDQACPAPQPISAGPRRLSHTEIFIFVASVAWRGAKMVYGRKRSNRERFCAIGPDGPPGAPLAGGGRRLTDRAKCGAGRRVSAIDRAAGSLRDRGGRRAGRVVCGLGAAARWIPASGLMKRRDACSIDLDLRKTYRTFARRGPIADLTQPIQC